MSRLILFVLGALLVGLLAAAPADARGPHRVSIAVSDSSVDAGDRVRIHGMVVPAYSRPVMLQMRYGRKWVKVDRRSTTSAGRYSFKDLIRNTRDRHYRVCKIGGSAVCSRSLLVRVATGTQASQPTIDINSVTSYELTTDESFEISGATSSDLAGKSIYLQLLNDTDSSWASISEPLTVQANGDFHFVVPARQAGRDLKLRIFAPATASTRAAHEDTNPFTVYGWYYVDTLDWVEGYDWHAGPVSINGNSFPRSVYTQYNASEAVDLGRKCRTLRATVGLSDDSSSSIRVTTSVTADSTEISRIDGIGLGQSTPIDLDVTGILRLAFSATRTSGTGSRTLAYGDARALCAF